MLTVDRESLLRAVKLASSAIPRNTPKLCLHGLLIKSDKEGLTVTGTNLELTVAVKVRGVQVEQPLEALPNAQKIISVLSECPDQEVRLEKDDDNLTIRGQFSETVLKDCDKPEVYPVPVNQDADNCITLPTERLATALRRVAPHAASESARYALTGVKFEPTQGKLILVATDGKKMACEEIEAASIDSDERTLVVPSNAIKSLLDSCRGDDGEITIGFTNNMVCMTVDGVTVHSKLAEGRYPTWREVFPKSTLCEIPLMAGPLLTVTRQASIMMTEDTRGVEYQFDKGTVRLKSSSDAGKANIQLPVAYDGKPITTTLAGDLVSQMLCHWPANTEFQWCCTKNDEVVELRFPDSFRALIVPLKVGGKQ